MEGGWRTSGIGAHDEAGHVGDERERAAVGGDEGRHVLARVLGDARDAVEAGDDEALRGGGINREWAPITK